MNKSIEFLKEYVMPKQTVVLAISGGPDSMVLFDLFLKLRDFLELTLVCAHINHSLREESKEEYEFVKEFCNKNNVIFEGTTFENYTSNIEGEAHDRRYAFFEELIKKYNASYLATAHHGDDLVETILMKITRGSSLDGYSGFNKISKRDGYSLIRPLIFYTKEEILKYANDNNIEYRLDKTNESDNYTRNRYRNHVLPVLKNENKDIHLKYLKFSEELSKTSSFVNKYVSNKYKEVVKDNIINLDLLKEEEDYIIEKVIYEYLKENYLDNYKLIESKHIDSIISIIKSNKPNLSVFLPNNIIIRKDYKTLYLDYLKDDFEYKYELTDEVKVYNGKFTILKETDMTNNYICHLNSNDIKLPLYIRNKKDGDKIEVLNLSGSKKVKDIFIDSKININERNIYPILVDSEDKVLWIPGIKKSKYDRIKTGNYDIIIKYEKENENE
ncbi:MAG: tRNA lysidine(34) synthetase TilS [Bacilli bacterium]|nr:tRNA lysidine(34) synthetase TilS [Bacilli bacterium]